MPARLLFLVVFAAALLWPGVAWGAVVVPDQYASISAAIASGADTVWVRDGIYNEVVTVARPLVIARDGPGLLPVLYPNVTGLVVSGGPEGWIHIVGLRFFQAVQLLSRFPGPELWLDSCVVSGGITSGAGIGPRLRVTGCQVTDDMTVFPWSLEFTGNTVTGGGLHANYEAFATISENWFENASGFAITLDDDDRQGVITDNVVSDCGGGIHLLRPGGTRIERNLVEHCAGQGIEADPGAGTNSIFASENVLRDLGGDGIVFGSLGGTAIGNTVERIAGAGIRVDVPAAAAWRIAGNRVTDAGEGGVVAVEGSSITVFAGNTILRSGGAGARLHGVARADSNVVGRCRWDGIYVGSTAGAFGAAHNTLYLNGGSGLTVHSAAAGSLFANIGYGNAGYALDWLGAGTATLACNLGFGNFAGFVRGAEPGGTDREGNPLFCNLPADDVHLGPGSAAYFAGCETAGALGPGCSESVGVGGGAALAFLRCGPQPARSGLRFETEASSPVRLEVFDTAGARRWARVLSAGRATCAWDLRDVRGERLAPGVYFARATSADRTTVARVVVAR